MQHGVKLALLCACCAIIEGCSRESHDGDAVVFSYAGWVPMALVLAGVACTASGIVICKNNANEKASYEALPDLAKATASAQIPSLRDAQTRMSFFRSAFVGWFLIAAGPFVILSAPSYYLASVRAGRDRLSIESGSWIFPQLHEIKFRELSRIELIDEARGTRQTEMKTYLNCRHVDGSKEHVLIGELEGLALEKILEIARDNGIPVVDLRDGE